MLLAAIAFLSQDLTPASLRANPPTAATMPAVVRWFGGDPKVGAVKVSGIDVAWHIEAGNAERVRAVSSDGTLNVPLARVAGTDSWWACATVPHGIGVLWTFEVDGQARGPLRQLEAYIPDPDNSFREGVPRGEVVAMPKHTSRVFEGATRDWWVYVPKQYDPAKPACVMVFQDGQWARNWAPPAFDNLIHRGEMPVTIAIFLPPGTRPNGQANRNFEYDTVDDRYAKFLLEEILPEVGRRYRVREDAAGRAIAGASSGAICAFNVAWQRPDQFSKVLSWIGSYVDLTFGRDNHNGGTIFPAMVRKADRKPIRVFLQDGRNDLDNPFGNWWLANLQMERALAWRQYDYTFVGGNGFHNDQHGRNLLPQALRWLWRDMY